MKFLCLLLSVVYISVTVVDSRKSGGGYKEAILSCNAYLDSMIKEVLEDHRDFFDPHAINETLLIFRKKVVFIDFKGEAKLTEGYIKGLQNLRRVSSCSLTFDKGRLKVNAKLEIPKLAFNFTGSLKALKAINKTIFAKGDTSKVFLSTMISLDSEGKRSVLEDLNVTFVSNISIEVEGSKFLGWMEETMETSLVQFLVATTKSLVEEQMKKRWIERMKAKPFSLEQYELDTGDLEITTPDDDSFIGEPVYTKEDANSYIDSVLENRFLFEADYSKLEPYTLPDDRIDKVYISDEKVNYVKLTDGRLEFLAEPKRIQDCTQPILRTTNISFNCFLGFKQTLRFFFTAESHNGDTTSKFDIVVLVEATRLGAKITTTVQDNIPSLLELNVNFLGKVKVKGAHVIADAPSMQAESTFDKDVLLNHFSEKLRKILLGKFKDVLSYSIYKTPVHFIR